MASQKKTTTAVVDIKDSASTNGTGSVYDVAQAELDRIAASDAAGRKVDKALEEARGKDTWRAHIQLAAAREMDDRAEARFDEATETRANQFDAIQKKADTHQKDALATQKRQYEAVQKKADTHHKATLKQMDADRTVVVDTLNEHHSEAISLAEQQFTDLTSQVDAAQTTIVGEVGVTRDEVLNGQAVLGEAITTAQQAAAKDATGIVQLVEDSREALVGKTTQDRDAVVARIAAFDEQAQVAFDTLSKSVQTVHENLARSQDEDGKTILETLRAQHEATLELVKSLHADLDTKLAAFREEVARDAERTDTANANQHAAVRGDLNVVLSLLSDIRKDQIGRPDRR